MPDPPMMPRTALVMPAPLSFGPSSLASEVTAVHQRRYAIFGDVLEQTVSVIPGWSKDQTRNLEIPRCAIAHLRFDASHRPGMTATKKCWLRRRFDTSSYESHGIDRLALA